MELFTLSVSWLDMTPFTKYAFCPLQFYQDFKVNCLKLKSNMIGTFIGQF